MAAEHGGTRVSVVANIFHAFPHLDFNFHNTSSVFTPDSTSYQQVKPLVNVTDIQDIFPEKHPYKIFKIIF